MKIHKQFYSLLKNNKFLFLNQAVYFTLPTSLDN